MSPTVRRLAAVSTRARLLIFLAVVGFAVLAAGDGREVPARAEPRAPQPDAPPPAVPAGQVPVVNVVRQGFPAAKFNPNEMTKSDTAWEIEWDLTSPDNRAHMPPGTTMCPHHAMRRGSGTTPCRTAVHARTNPDVAVSKL